jgi:sulfatase modifying factor 1
MPGRFQPLVLLILLSALCLPAQAESTGNAGRPGMAFIPRGEWTPLFREEKEPKQVKVQGFYLDTLAVSNQDYLEFVRANPKWRRSSVKRLFADEDYLKTWRSDLDFGSGVISNAPVTYVSWFAAKAYASWQGKRLPTTAEWEYAANASYSSAAGEKDKEFIRLVREWYSTPSPEVIPAGGTGRANYFGVQDMHGLIWEWVADFSTAMVTGDARGDTGLDRQLFCGGGSQGAKERDNFPAFMRYGFRSSLKASYTVHNLGFRCASDVER